MSNKYKIDCNEYSDYPFLLKMKSHWYSKWERIGSFKTVEDAKKKFAEVDVGLPIYLN